MKRVALGFGVLVLFVAGAAAYFRIDAAAATPRLLTSMVTRGAIVQMVSSTGTLQPVDTVEVGTQVSGTIKTLGADFNSIVKKGQVIAMLDPALFESQVEQARASVARLRADVEQSRVNVKDTQQKLARAKALQSQQLIAQSDFDAAQIAADASAAAVKSQEAQLGQAEAALRQSEVSLSNTIIRTPVDGIVLSRNVQVGQTMSAGLQAPTLFVIARNLGTMQLNASVNEADIGLVQAAQPVSFTVDAYGEQLFGGKVREVRLQPTTTNNVVTYTVVIDVPNADQKLKPGMTATVSIEVARADDVVRVPAAAVRFQPTQDVLVAINGKSAEDGNAPANRAANGRANGKSIDASSRRGNGNWTAKGNGPWAGKSVTANASSSSTNASAAATNASAGAASPSPIIVWTLAGGRLTPVRATTGLSDGMQVALLNTSLQPGAEIVTGLVKASTSNAAASASQSSSPLMPTMPRRGPGGFGGGPRA
jgi:HlyD family secretion protein